MSTANYSVTFTAILSAITSNVSVGDVLCTSANNDGYVIANTANKGSRHSVGIARTAATYPGSVVIQSTGIVDASITGLGIQESGLSLFVRVSDLGQLERVLTVGDSDEIVGKADEFGNLLCGFVGQPPVTANTIVATDIARSGVTGNPIDKVQGLLQVPLDTATVPVGGSYVRNAVASNSFKGKKSVQPGHYDPADYGSVGDGTSAHPADAAFAACLAAIPSFNPLSGRGNGASIVLSESNYYLAENLILEQNVNLFGANGGSFSSNTVTQLRFAPGKGIWVKGFCGYDKPSSVGARIGNLGIVAQAVPSIQTYQHSHAYIVGDLAYLPHHHEHVYECIGAGTSAARPYAAWQANHSYSVGDRVTPTTIDGHTYICRRSAGNTASVEPTWKYVTSQFTNDGAAFTPPALPNVIWESETTYFSTWPSIAMQPLTDAQNAAVKWTALHAYPYNSVVRMPGNNSNVFHQAGQGGLPVGGTSGSTPLPTSSQTPETSHSDGGLTWIAKDGAAYIITDGSVVWVPRQHNCIAISGHCLIEDVSVTGATNFGVQIQASTGAPANNADGWQLSRVYGSANHGFLRVRGDDGNTGHASSCQMIGNNDGVHAYEWDHGFYNTSSTGNLYSGCFAQSATGHSYHTEDSGLGSTFVNCYSETATPSVIKGGTVIGGVMTQMPFSNDTNGVVLSGGGSSKNIYTMDVTNSTANVTGLVTGTLYTYLGANADAGRKGAVTLAVQAEAETSFQGLTWSNIMSGCPTGWWYWALAPLTYGALYSSYAISGDSSSLLRGTGTLTDGAAAGHFMFPTEGYYVGGRSGATIRRHQNVKLDALGAGIPTLPLSGTWVTGDVLWNTVGDTNVGMGIAQWWCTAGGSHGAWGEVPVRLVATVTTTNNSATSLLQTDGTEIVLPDTSSFSMRITVLGSRTDAGNRVREVHEVLAHTTGGTLTIDDDDTVSTSTFPAGWAITITAVATRKLRIQCTGNTGQTVKWKATVEITTLAGN